MSALSMVFLGMKMKQCITHLCFQHLKVEKEQSVVLEEKVSPYRLSEDLVIKAEHSLIIKDGAELRVSDVSITIYGIADIGNAVIPSTEVVLDGQDLISVIN